MFREKTLCIYRENCTLGQKIGIVVVCAIIENMNKLNFLVDWGDNKRRAWSGTCWGLYQSLRQYFVVTDIDTTVGKSFIYKVLRKLGIVRRDMGCKDILVKRSKVLPLLEKQDTPVTVFQFEETVLGDDHINTYVYKDLTVSYVKYMSQYLPVVFRASGFSNFSQSAIDERLAVEVESQQHLTGMFCMGEWLRQDCINRLGLSPKWVHAVGGGINLDIRKCRPTEKSNNKVLFVGRDFKRKGGYFVYNAFCELKKSRPGVELYVAGPPQNPISKPIDGYHYLGDLDHDALSDYFNKCDIFCMPSYFEAYGLVFIEALTYGLPCIGRNCYEMPYFIQDGETGLLVDSDDVIELANKMSHLLVDEKIKSNVIARREYYINNYSWDAVANRIANVISNES